MFFVKERCALRAKRKVRSQMRCLINHRILTNNTISAAADAKRAKAAADKKAKDGAKKKK
jgi:hypothetical protein